MKNKQILFLVITFSFSVLFYFCAHTPNKDYNPQKRCGATKGQVIDGETDKPIKGVLIEILETDFSTTTDKKGYYIIENIPVGLYDIKAEAEKYQVLEIQGTLILKNVTTVENFYLYRSTYPEIIRPYKPYEH